MNADNLPRANEISLEIAELKSFLSVFSTAKEEAITSKNLAGVFKIETIAKVSLIGKRSFGLKTKTVEIPIPKLLNKATTIAFKVRLEQLETELQMLN